MKKVIATDWKSRRLRVGWTIRTKSGQLGVVTWISNGCVMYTIKNK